MTALKPCTQCGDPKPADAFGRNGDRPQSRCKSCERERAVYYRLRGASVRAKDTGGLTHEAIAKRLGISKAGVQLIEARPLKKLRAPVGEEWR